MMEGWKRRRLSAGVENPIDVSLTCILGGDGSFLVLAQFRHQCASKCQGVNHTSFTRIHAQQSRWMDANISTGQKYLRSRGREGSRMTVDSQQLILLAVSIMTIALG